MAVADNESALCIQQLVAYACERGLIQTEDLTWCYNALLDMLSYEGPAPVKSWEKIDLTAFNLDQTLAELARLAVSHGLVENTQSGEDSFAMRVMGLLLPKPSEVARHFNELYASEGPRAATDWFYTLCCDAGYVRRSAIARNITWTTPTTWGDLEITINLSKPEKDPREIAAAKTAQNTSGEKYPACQLCLDNEGYSGRGASSGAGAHPARQNLRIIPIELNQHRWGFQYSPYAYFNEHCIAMNSDHIPMHIDHEALVNLFDFVDRFPHYFIGSNADLPIVGGSILSHDHYQGGCYEFPMMRAEVAEEFELRQRARSSSGRSLFSASPPPVEKKRSKQRNLSSLHGAPIPTCPSLFMQKLTASPTTRLPLLFASWKMASTRSSLHCAATLPAKNIRLASSIHMPSITTSRKRISASSRLWALPYFLLALCQNSTKFSQLWSSAWQMTRKPMPSTVS